MTDKNGFFSFSADYLARLKGGDVDTQRHFVEYFGELLRWKLRGRLGRPELVEEARQEVFLRVFDALRKDGIQQPARFGAFVNSVATHVIQEYQRNEGRTSPMPADWNPQDFGMDVEAAAVTDERKRFVEKVLREMPAPQQRLLRDVFLDERDKEDVCRHHGVDRDYLRVLLFRARKRFGQLMQMEKK